MFIFIGIKKHCCSSPEYLHGDLIFLLLLYFNHRNLYVDLNFED